MVSFRLEIARLITRAAAVGFAISLLTSCGSESSPPVADDPYIRAEIANTSAFQQAFFSDGRLTYEEYEQAVFQTVRCLRERGVAIVTEPYPIPGKLLSFEFGSGPSQSEVDYANQSYEECYREFQVVVDMVWVRQNAPDERTMAEAREALRQCLRDGGVEGVPSDAARRDFQPFYGHPAFRPCADKISTEFDIPHFAG